MQRLSSGLVAVLSIITLASVPACKGDSDSGEATSAAKPTDKSADGAADSSAVAAGAEAGAAAGEAGGAAVEPADDGAAAEAGAAGTEAGAAEAGAEAGAEIAPPEDQVPALFELAKSLDNDDAAAQKALDDAVKAGAAKLDAAKIANGRGEALLTKGEAERAEPFFVWARDAHSLYAEPVFNLAKMSALAGDLELAKEHLAELEKRGNKKLMKKVGVELAFAPLHDDPDVRKIYEK